ncbi:hypothetical protein GJU39_17435 [Pedobacter petrophilus]|uniref:HlyD family efflux transporter periplasmic adaptor subunit n=1 Tax=Pedobacter petrophilus TaxID=1908241 RepID=A0A7K0G215_9SPHI|nr:hypothetical protein [Pedobacter petrophilus]MRX77868.1 hypothetical protein [Pedobacter petrophilus]
MDKKAHIYSAEIKEIVGEPPKWLLKSGGGSLLLLLFMLGGLSAFTRYPEKEIIPVHIYRGQNAFIISKKYCVKKFLKASGTQVKKGEAIAQADSKALNQTITAPFAGKLFYDEDALTNPSKPDTLALLVSSEGPFKFKGKIGTEYAHLLTTAKATSFKIAINNQVVKDLALYGKLNGFGPLKSGNTLAFTGTIEPASGKIIDDNYLAIQNLEGKLTLILDNKTILSRILN